MTAPTPPCPTHRAQRGYRLAGVAMLALAGWLLVLALARPVALGVEAGLSAAITQVFEGATPKS